MARKKIEFKPDPTGGGILNKLYITPKQRKTIRKWLCYSLVCVACLVIQDSVLGRARLFGGMVDLASAAIALICVLEGSESGGVFALAASAVFVFSGSAPDDFSIALLTVYGCLAALFRESFLRRGFPSAWLCAGTAVVLYEISVFALGLLRGVTYLGRMGAFGITAALSVAVMPVLYPLLRRIGKIGGETWKE